MDEDERRKLDRANYHVKPFPPSKVNEFLFSKRFFLHAAKAWFSNQYWSEMSSFKRSSFFIWENGLFFQFAQTYNTPFLSSSARSLRKMNALRELEVEVECYQFESVEYKLAWEDIFDTSELEQLPIAAYLSNLRGLTYFSMAPGSCFYANTQRKKEIWRSNVEALEALVKPKAMLPGKVAPSMADWGRLSRGCSPLYLSSQVCKCASESICLRRKRVQGLFNQLVRLFGSKE